MGLLTRAGDLVYTFRFLKLLVTPFNKTKAFELGIIDEKGVRDKSVKLDSTEKKSAFTTFHRLVFNIKKLMAKAPGGGTRLASYAAALFLIKEKLELSDDSISQIVEKSGVDPLDFLNEQSEWFLLDDGALTPGTYQVREDKVVNSTIEELVRRKDHIIVSQDCYPVGDIYGIDIYEVTHKKTNQKLYVTVNEIYK